MKRQTFKIAGTLLLLAAVLCAPAAAQQLQVATAEVASGSLYWNVHVGYDGLKLSVAGEGRHVSRTFESGETPSFSVFDAGGEALADGTYKWELVVLPKLVELDAKEFENLRSSFDGTDVRSARAPERQVATGSFTVRGGQIVDPDLSEGPAGGPAQQGNTLSAKDQVFLDDVIVDGSLCVGFDCVNGESFGFDTLRLKENNLRVHFWDTSSSGSFPRNQWRLVANDSTNGGLSHFSIDDVSAGRTPVRIEAGARSNSLYVDTGGRTGFGTNTPVVELHVVDGDSPTLRLAQDGSSGFTAQTWDLAGNEANFFIRDVTNGSKLPFRIRPGAPESSIDIAATGNVGIGTQSPSAPLHVRRTGGSAQLLVEEASGTDSTRTMALFRNNGNSIISFDDTGVGTGVEWNFGLGNTDQDFVISEQGSGRIELEIDSGSGNVTIAGQLVTGGPQCGSATPCDRVFSPDYEVESIEEHAAQMWANSYLPAVGPTEPNAPMNLSEKTGRILNELEKAHIYIEQLNDRLKQKDERIAQVEENTTELIAEKDQRIDELEERLLALEELLENGIER